MKDLALFFSTMAIFRFGFSIMKKVDEFIAENQQEYPEKRQDMGSGLFMMAKKPIL